MTPLLASAWIAWFAIAMASKSIIENFLSWLILFFDKSINIWDIIYLSDWTIIEVEEIDIRTTKLKTFDWNTIIIPNSQLLNEKIINRSLKEINWYKKVKVEVWISYWDDVNKAKEIIKKLLLEIKWIDEKTLTIYVDNLNEYSINIVWYIIVEYDK